VDRLSSFEALKEALAFGLRNMHRGIDPQALALKHKSVLPTNWEDIIKKLCDSGWLDKKSSGNIYISPAGALFADAVMREILCA